MSSLLDCPIPEQAWLREVGQRNGAFTVPARLDAALESQRDVPDAGPWEPAVMKLVEFEHLGDNWDGLGARAPSSEMLASAIGLAYCFLEQAVDPPDCVVPGLEGSVMFEWHDPDGTYTEVEIVRPLYAEVMVIEPGKPARHWTLPTR
ncbi:MAG TPA: hypothetical protein VMF69_05955 [Gemmataceae bacterium]|nr:hypothetical protein [Gemmataceae bacterium]